MHEHIMSDADQERADAIKNAILDLCLQQKVNALIALSATRCASECFEEIIREQGGEVFTVATPSPSLAAREAAEEIETRAGLLPLSLIDEIQQRRNTTYKGMQYHEHAAEMKTDLDYALAFIEALRHRSPIPAAGGEEDAGLHDLLRHVLACAGDADCETCAEAKKIADGESANA